MLVDDLYRTWLVEERKRIAFVEGVRPTDAVDATYTVVDTETASLKGTYIRDPNSFLNDRVISIP